MIPTRSLRGSSSTARRPIRCRAATGADAVRHLLDRAAVMLAFEQVGCAQAALEMARDYARERYAFGRPIGSFQAIKHKLADIYIAVELARSNAYYGAWALHTDAAELPIAAVGRAHLGLRRGLAGVEGEHPDAWRHGLHLADGLPVLLPPLQAARAGAGRHARVEARLIAELRKSNTVALPTD